MYIDTSEDLFINLIGFSDKVVMQLNLEGSTRSWKRQITCYGLSVRDIEESHLEKGTT